MIIILFENAESASPLALNKAKLNFASNTNKDLIQIIVNVFNLGLPSFIYLAFTHLTCTEISCYIFCRILVEVLVVTPGAGVVEFNCVLFWNVVEVFFFCLFSKQVQLTLDYQASLWTSSSSCSELKNSIVFCDFKFEGGWCCSPF